MMQLKWYTRARRFPQMIGRTPDGTRIPGGPYTYTQIGIAVGVAVLLSQTTTVWAHGPLIFNAALFLGVCGAAVFFTGKLPPGFRNPVVMVAGAKNVLVSGYRIDGQVLRSAPTKPVASAAPVLIYETTAPITVPDPVPDPLNVAEEAVPPVVTRRRPGAVVPGLLQPQPALSSVQRLLLEKS